MTGFLAKVFDLVSLIQIFIFLSWTGMLLCAIAAWATPDRKCLIPHWLYQASFVIVALALGWGTAYGENRAWEPWPPHVMLVAGINFYLLLRVIRSAYIAGHIHRFWRAQLTSN